MNTQEPMHVLVDVTGLNHEHLRPRGGRMTRTDRIALTHLTLITLTGALLATLTRKATR